MTAWFGFVGSTEIATGTRVGCKVVSMRVNVTDAGSALFVFVDTNTRPPEVDAQSVSWSVARETATRLPPLRVPPNAAADVRVGPPSGNQSVPQLPVNSWSLVPN